MTIPTLSFFAAAFAFVAAYCWWKTGRVYEPAVPRDDNAIGPLVDGSIIIKVRGKRAQLYGTLEIQSKWNSRGAQFAAISASFAGVTAILSGIGTI